MDEVVCAIPPSTDPGLYEEAAKYGRVFKGSEDDVLKRYYECAHWCEADVIMRITGDCPLISPELCGEVLTRFKDNGSDYSTDYASNIMPRTFPRGLDCEVFTFGLLDMAHHEATSPSDREHVTPWMQKWAAKRVNIESPWPIDGRLCIDTQDDYKVLCAHFGHEPYKHLRAA